MKLDELYAWTRVQLSVATSAEAFEYRVPWSSYVALEVPAEWDEIRQRGQLRASWGWRSWTLNFELWEVVQDSGRERVARWVEWIAGEVFAVLTARSGMYVQAGVYESSGDDYRPILRLPTCLAADVRSGHREELRP